MSQNESDRAQLEEKIEQIASDGGDVRAKTREAVLETLRQGEKSLNRFSEVAGSFVLALGDASSKRGVGPNSKQIEQMAAGFQDAFQSSLNALAFALEEAKSRGEKFADDDLKQFGDEMKEVQQSIFDAVKNLSSRTSEEIQEEIKLMSTHFKRVAEHLQPTITTGIAALTTQTKDTAGGTLKLLADVFLGAIDGATEALKREQSEESKK